MQKKCPQLGLAAYGNAWVDGIIVFISHIFQTEMRFTIQLRGEIGHQLVKGAYDSRYQSIHDFTSTYPTHECWKTLCKYNVQCVNTEFTPRRSQVLRAVRLRECPLRELRLYEECIRWDSPIDITWISFLSLCIFCSLTERNAYRQHSKSTIRVDQQNRILILVSI